MFSIAFNCATEGNIREQNQEESTSEARPATGSEESHMVCGILLWEGVPNRTFSKQVHTVAMFLKNRPVLQCGNSIVL